MGTQSAVDISLHATVTELNSFNIKKVFKIEIWNSVLRIMDVFCCGFLLH